MHEYVVLENTLDYDTWLLCMHATPTIHKGITDTYVFELTTSTDTPGKVFLRQKHRMGQSVPFSPRSQFFPHPDMPKAKPQSLPLKTGSMALATFKSWDTCAKARAVLAKQIGIDEAREKLPVVTVDWAANNTKVIKELTKFANNEYEEHIVTPAQSTELLAMISNLPSTAESLPASRKYTSPLLWALWDNQHVAVAVPEPQPAAPALEEAVEIANTDTSGPEQPVLEPEAVPILPFGLSTKQTRVQERAAAALLLTNVPVPVMPTNVPAPVIKDSLPVPDANPSPPKRRRRRSTRKLVVKKWMVGRKVKMPAWQFGKPWAIEEFGKGKYKSKVMLGTIVSGAGRYK